MRRIVICAVVMGLLAGVSYGVDYSFVGSEVDQSYDWDNVNIWNPTLLPPGTTGDSYTIAAGAQAETINLPTSGTGNTRYFGDLTITSGTLSGRNVGSDMTFRFVADNGHSGSLTGSGSATDITMWNTANRYSTFDLDGDLDVPSLRSGSLYDGRRLQLVLRGSNNFVKWGTGASGNYGMHNATVKSGATYDFQQTDANKNFGMLDTGQFVVESGGTATGAIEVFMKDVSKTLSMDGAGDTTGLDVHYKHNYKSTDPVITNGGQLPGRAYHDVSFDAIKTGASWVSSRTVYITGGDLTVHGSLYLPIGPGTINSKSGAAWLLDTADNGTGAGRDIMVHGDMYLGKSNKNFPSPLSGIEGGLKANDSTVTVKGDLILGGNNVNYTYNAGGYIIGDTATFNIGGDYTVTLITDSKAKHDMGTSTVVFDGAGVGNAQVIASKYYPFYNVTINNPGGAVSLGGSADDNLLIHGDLQILAAASFNTNGRVVTFNGPGHLLNDQVGVTFDNVELLADAVVDLGSDITITKLMMGAGSEMYLLGHTLYADGQTYSGEGTWSNDDGTIYGDVIPEPATMLLLGTGALGVLGYIRRRRMR